MAWTTNPYATLAQVKAALDLQATRDDVWLQELIEEAGEEINRYVGYPFQTDGSLSTPATRLYDGNDTEQLMIDKIVSISQVLEDSVDITSDVVLGPNNYQMSDLQAGYLLRRKSGMVFQLGVQNYSVSGVFGVPVIPPAIARACVRLVIHWYKMRDTNYADTMMEQGSVRQKYNKPIPPDVIELLTQYRRRLFLAW